MQHESVVNLYSDLYLFQALDSHHFQAAGISYIPLQLPMYCIRLCFCLDTIGTVRMPGKQLCNLSRCLPLSSPFPGIASQVPSFAHLFNASRTYRSLGWLGSFLSFLVEVLEQCYLREGAHLSCA